MIDKKVEDLTLLTLFKNKKMPIVDGKKFVISDSTKKKKP